MTLPPEAVVITGASRGIGAALATEYAAPGRRLGLLGRDAAALENVAAACRTRGAEVVTAVIDVRNRDAMAEWLDRFDAAHPVSLIIANAGVSSSIGPDGMPESPGDTWRTFDINLTGAVNTIAPLIEPMCRRGHGHVAVMGSLSGLFPFPNTPAYSASKAGLQLWARALADAHRGDGLVVSVVCPGFVASDMSDRVRGPRPLIMSGEAAARRIRNALDRKKRMIAFPTSLRWGIAMLRLLPDSGRRFILRRFHYTVDQTRPANPGE